MKKVFIVHGFQGSPNGGWRPWLMGELEKEDVYACALPMPTPNDPVPSEWVAEIARVVERDSRDQIYLVGHSLGVPAILRFLETTNATNVKGAVLVSGPIYKNDKKKVYQFLENGFVFSKVKAAGNNFVVIHGDNDRNVSFEQGEYLAKELRAELIAIENGGHLNGSSGWLTLPQCLGALNKMFSHDE
jgi:predicted alpha/beta hydrolase family esterase